MTLTNPLPVSMAPTIMSDDPERDRKDADAMLASGAGVALIGALSFAVGGAVCPVCVVAAPALLAVGAVRRLRARRAGVAGG